MTSKVQLDRDVISRIYKHNVNQGMIKGELDLSKFKLGLVSKKCLMALRTACNEECKAATLDSSSLFQVKRDLDFIPIVVIPEPVFWLLKELGLCELEFCNCNDPRSLQLLRKIKGFGLKRISFCWSSSGRSDPDHRSEKLRIILESSGTLKELCNVPDIFLPHLPHTLKLEKLTISLNSIRMNSYIKDCLQLSTKKVEIYVNDCYLPSHLLENINAQTLHVLADGSWAEGIEENSVEIQANPSIQEISIVLENDAGIPDKIYDIKKIIESIQKGYPNLTLLNIQDKYDMMEIIFYGNNGKYADKVLIGQALPFFTKLFIKTEALLNELQDLSFSIKIEQVLDSDDTFKCYKNILNEVSSLRKDEWKDFKEVQDNPRAETGGKYLSLKKSIQFGEGKSLEVTVFIRKY